MLRAASALALLLVTIATLALAADLEPARDALRRHEYERAVGLLRTPAEAGDAEASFLLSQLLRYGRGVAPDLPQSCRLLEKSASTGHARAAGTLAAMIESGECAASSPRTPDEWRAVARSGGYAPPAAKTIREDESAAASPERLLRATRAGDLPQVRRLLESLPADVRDDYGRTPFMLAVEAGNVALAREFATRGASFSAADRNGDTALLVAVRSGHAELLSLLLEGGAPVNAANASGTTPLMLAASAGSLGMCERLLAAGADTGMRDASGLRAGDHAARAGHLDLAAQLGVSRSRGPVGPIQTGALNAGRTSLMIAAERGDMKSLDARLAAGDDVNAADSDGMTALTLAARAGQSAALKALLAAGAAVDAPDRAGWTPLGQAIRAGQTDTARLLLEGGANKRTLQGGVKPLLLVAIESKPAEAVHVLLAAGADPNAGDNSGLTPLMAAAHANNAEAITLLLSAGARPDSIGAHRRTALWYAASQSSQRAAAVLAPRTNLELADDEGNTPLAIAVSRGNRAIVEALLKAGADVRGKSRSGNSVLHVAAAAGHATLVPILIAARAPVDGVNAHGDTALILGVKSHCFACARDLVVAGASTRVRNADGLSAADVARLSSDKALLDLLD